MCFLFSLQLPPSSFTPSLFLLHFSLSQRPLLILKSRTDDVMLTTLFSFIFFLLILFLFLFISPLCDSPMYIAGSDIFYSKYSHFLSSPLCSFCMVKAVQGRQLPDAPPKTSQIEVSTRDMKESENKNIVVVETCFFCVYLFDSTSA